MDNVRIKEDDMEPTMTVAEAEFMHNRGTAIVTMFAQVATSFEEFAGIFESRGGAAGMGPEFGSDTEIMIGTYNNLAAMLAANNGCDQQVLDKYRTDY
jgi:hypothetical protein